VKSRLFPVAVLLGVFLLGGVAGFGASRAYTLRELRSRFEGAPGEVRANLRVEAMRRQLDLSADQVAKIEGIFSETDGEFERTMKPCRDGLEGLRERTDAHVLEVLDPEQQTKFKAFAERRKHRPRGPFPPPPPN
jgi:Spy/CpxP family protein refolding chaperone